jgi:hypothetical protein
MEGYGKVGPWEPWVKGAAELWGVVDVVQTNP